MRWGWGPLCSRPTRWVGFFFIVLAYWNNSPRVDMSLYSDTLSWFQAIQSLLLLLNAASLAEKNKYQFNSLWGEHANHYTIDAVTNYICILVLIVTNNMEAACLGDQFHDAYHNSWNVINCLSFSTVYI